MIAEQARELAGRAARCARAPWAAPGRTISACVRRMALCALRHSCRFSAVGSSRAARIARRPRRRDPAQAGGEGVEAIGLEGPGCRRASARSIVARVAAKAARSLSPGAAAGGRLPSSREPGAQARPCAPLRQLVGEALGQRVQGLDDALRVARRRDPPPRPCETRCSRVRRSAGRSGLVPAARRRAVASTACGCCGSAGPCGMPSGPRSSSSAGVLQLAAGDAAHPIGHVLVGVKSVRPLADGSARR